MVIVGGSLPRRMKAPICQRVALSRSVLLTGGSLSTMSSRDYQAL